MGVFSKFYEWKLRRELKKIDLPEAARAIRSQFAGKEMVIPKELAAHLKAFLADPTEKHAARLIAYDPKIAELFGAFTREIPIPDSIRFR